MLTYATIYLVTSYAISLYVAYADRGKATTDRDVAAPVGYLTYGLLFIPVCVLTALWWLVTWVFRLVAVLPFERVSRWGR